jgi:hypothetical protein
MNEQKPVNPRLESGTCSVARHLRQRRSSQPNGRIRGYAQNSQSGKWNVRQSPIEISSRRRQAMR